jgi:hypothetical protein
LVWAGTQNSIFSAKKTVSSPSLLILFSGKMLQNLQHVALYSPAIFAIIQPLQIFCKMPENSALNHIIQWV